MSLVVVMLAVSLSLVLTYAFLRTQTTMLQISRNGQRQDAALQAARAGAAVALQRLQSPEWEGVGEELSRGVTSDADGSSRFHVALRPLAAGDDAADAALCLVVSSRGIWQSAADEDQRVERTVEVVVRLHPRAPAGSGGTAVSDVAANPSDYDRIQAYALFAEQAGTSLVLDPGDRIEGPVWLNDELRVFRDPAWNTDVRNELLDSVAAKLVSGGTPQFRHPHPLSGEVTFYADPHNSVRADLQRLRTPWRRASSRLSLDSIPFSDWRRYRLYEGGFEYDAVEVGSALQNVELRPTAGNPLGIFFRNGSVRLDDRVTIQGTLVATGDIQIDGDFVHVSSFNWRGADGELLVDGAGQWPRLPALVADEVRIDRAMRAVIEGAIIAGESVTGAGGELELVATTNVDIAGTASCRPLRQPLSSVQLQNTPDLRSLNQRGDYAVWIGDDTRGGWHAIVGVDVDRRQLTVVGELAQAAAVPYRIRGSRRHYIDLYGPVAGERHDINRTDSWGNLSTSTWNERYAAWEFTNYLRDRADLAPLSFVDWLSNPLHFPGWPQPYSQYGLTLEPTFHLRATPDRRYRWSPPLFAAHDGAAGQQAEAGYRWSVLSWREPR